jgi:hypothetical protein
MNLDDSPPREEVRAALCWVRDIAAKNWTTPGREESLIRRACVEIIGNELRAADMLIEALVTHAGRLEQLLPTTGPVVREGMHVWDAVLADHLDGIGPTGAEAAHKLRAKSAEAVLTTELDSADFWRWWSFGYDAMRELAQRKQESRGEALPTPAAIAEAPAYMKAPRWVIMLARTLWADQVRAAAERRARLRAPALVLPFARDIAKMRRAKVVNGRLVGENGVPSPLVPLAVIP